MHLTGVFDDELLDELLEECFEPELLPLEELTRAGFGDVPSRASKANTTLEKWPRNSGSKKRASLHIMATSRVGFLKTGPHP